jgi:CHAT domain-containing protein
MGNDLSQTEVLTGLAEQLRAGDQAAEGKFIAEFETQANRLLLEDEAGLATLVAMVEDIPLAGSRNRQLRHYFKGLALGLHDQYQDAIVIFDNLLADPNLDDYVHGRTLNSRAAFCQITGRLGESWAGHQASLALWERLGNQLYQGKSLVNLGILAYEFRRYDEAQNFLAEAAACFEAVNAPEWLTFVDNERGMIYRDLGRWEEALACFAIPAAEWTDTPLGLVQNNIGAVHLFQGNLAAAAAAYNAALEVLRTDTHAVESHLGLGLVHQASGDLTTANTALKTALGLALEINRRDILAEVYYRLGDLQRRLGQDQAALKQFFAAIDVIEASRKPLPDEGLKISLLGRWQQVYEATLLHLLAMGQYTEAFAVAERARARAFADAVADSIEPSSGSGIGSPVATAVEVRAALPENAALFCYVTTGALDQDLPLLQNLSTTNPVREHLLLPARTILFVLTRNSLSVHDCAIDPNAFSSESPRQDIRARFLNVNVLSRLYNFLLAPAGPNLEAEQLYIVPHGLLHHVPFGALPDPSGKPLVREGGPILAYAPSVTVLIRHSLSIPTSAAPDRMCLAVGYDSGEGEQALRHTEAEATLVARLNRGKALTGPEAKIKALNQVVENYRLLHFACHGQFNTEAPLESYLQVGASEQLNAVEVLRQWRLRARLVVLSACQTGVSRILRGDEPMGLTRAFLLVGAKSVLVTQWAVEDWPTFLLMQKFYQELDQFGGKPPAAALQAAQIWLRELSLSEAHKQMADLPADEAIVAQSNHLSETRPFAHPRYWAAFRLVGKM